MKGLGYLLRIGFLLDKKPNNVECRMYKVSKVGTCFTKSAFLWYDSSESAYFQRDRGPLEDLPEHWIESGNMIGDLVQPDYLVALVQTNKKPLQSLLTKDQNGVTD